MKAPGEKTALREDQELGVCDMLSPIQEPKWKSWLKHLRVPVMNGVKPTQNNAG